MKTLTSHLANTLDELTPAERLVAVHLAEGWSDKEIASLLSKAMPTIKNQVAAILRKSGVPTRARFVAVHYQKQIVELLAEVAALHHTFGVMPKR